MTKLKELDQNDDGVFKCPNCGEYELRQMQIWSNPPNDGINTNTYVCENPDCESEFNLMPNGELL